MPIAVAALVAAVLVLGAGYAASRRDPSDLATAGTAGDNAATTTTGAATTTAPPGGTAGPGTVPVPDPADPTTPTTDVSTPVPGAGPARPTTMASRPTTTRPASPPTTPAQPTTTGRPPDPSVCVTGAGCPGRAYWTSNDDRIHVCDATRDGYDVVAEYRRSDTSGTGRLESRGNGTCAENQLGLRAGATVTFRACLQDDHRNLSRCSDWVTGRP